MSIESASSFASKSMTTRICLVNDKGERVFDTIIKPVDNMFQAKPGIKNEIMKFSKNNAPTIDEVQKKVLELIKGKILVGYSIINKL